MNIHLVYILLLFAFQILTAQTDNSNKILYLKKTNSEIIIDGIIDSAWQQADSSSNFTQFKPYFNQKPTVETKVKIIADDYSLYCLFICKDDQTNLIQANKGMYDSFTGDIVSIMLDTFGDKQSAYKFAVNASGVMADSRLLDDGRRRDYTFDGVWFSAAKIYNWGYVVEMKIPFKTLKFNKDVNYWGIDFDRWRSVNKEDIYWSKYEQNEGLRISKFGKLIFLDTKPLHSGINLEIYPAGISKIFLQNNKYKFEPTSGLDITYTPSEQLTFLFTANPDFAQIEADPYNFNISRYETYLRERRPFFIVGSEIFNPAGNIGFYRPLELFYSRRIGKILPDGKHVPLILGSKIFGKIDNYDYGAFLLMTGEKSYYYKTDKFVEPKALFGSLRIKKKILENSTIGMLFVTKNSKSGSNSVLDIDGVFRDSDWQLSYQLASAFKNSKIDYAFSTGFSNFSKKWGTLFRLRAIGKNFDVSDIGFVPWKGTFSSTLISGPTFIFDTGLLSSIFTFAGLNINYEAEDKFYDRGLTLGINFEFRDERDVDIRVYYGKAKDNRILYDQFEISLDSDLIVKQDFNFELRMGYSKTYNFKRNYLANFYSFSSEFNIRPFDFINIGSSIDAYFEMNPSNNIEDITFSSRPFFSLIPLNNLSFRIYIDNLYLKSSDKLERLLIGILVSYNFSPKSWIYLAINELKNRSEIFDYENRLLLRKLNTIDRVSVLKINYLYYF